MSGSTFGKVFQLTTFGESHGPAIGGIIQGCPSGLSINLANIQRALDRRKPGLTAASSPRKEQDLVRILSGIYEGKTLGTPIGFVIENRDVQSKDYETFKESYRPSHADYSYDQKYGHRDPRGGGRSSARETACRVVAGALAEQILEKVGVRFSCYVTQIGPFKMEQEGFYPTEVIEESIVRCPSPDASQQMVQHIDNVKGEGDTLGGCIRGIIEGVPAGLGEPVFDKLHASLGKAMLSINAVKGFEIGSGFNAASMKGSEHNDLFEKDFTTKTNFSGGIQGGISNGMPISFRVAFKPVATLMQKQTTVSKKGELLTLDPKGRHDVCVVPRAVPIVQAMAALVILDAYLENKTLNFN
ncbi:MAG: chorismate synthase [Bacteroidetes bacterium]|nr:chorismate synthase [Bacteroidota bacterium]MBM3425025.1 chorismate synthase [Bacteroidota bacterium]